MNEREAAVWLNSISGLGGVRTQAVLDYFDRCDDIVKASETRLANVPGIGPKTAAEIAASNAQQILDSELKIAEANNVRITTLFDPDFPEQLKAIHDPPHVLYIKGKLKPEDVLAIAVVGARRCSVYGKTQAAKIAAGLTGHGITVVSGCALGIDAAAHRAALEAGGRTIGIVGSGLIKPYPKDNIDLMEEITHSGAVISEFHFKQGVERGNFVRRNRIISGLSLGTAVIEAAVKSGSLITARHSLEQGREVFAVPGSVDSPRSRGTHRLIKEGAKLIESARDIIEELGDIGDLLLNEEDSQTGTCDRTPDLKETEQKIFSLIEYEPVHIDQIISSSEMKPGSVGSILVLLEMKNMVRELPGKKYVKV